MVRVCCYRALSSSGPSPEEVAGMSMREAASKLAGSVVTSAGLVDACASRMESRRGLNAFVTESLESARKAAQASDARRAAGKALGPADGIPVAVKDNFCTLGERTSAGSRALESFISPYESTTTARLKASGAVVMGKTTMDEFGMGSFSMSGCTGPSLNPWGGEGGDGPFVAGGSSGGSAAAVAGGMAFAALGSDTGGSVRLPAAYTGCVGLKPSYGRLSRHGLIAYVSSTDCPGILARSVWDAAALLHLLQGEDAKDPTSLPPDPALGALVAGGADVWEEGVRGLRVGLPDEWYDGVRYGYRAAPAAGRSLHEEYAATRTEGLGPEVQRRILLGTFALSSEHAATYYGKAMQVRRVVADEFAAAFGNVDVLLTPTSPASAPRLEDAAAMPAAAMYATDVMTVPASLAGLPAVSVPVGVGGA